MATAMEPGDRSLMVKVASGDRYAFTELFDRHSPVVLGVLTRMLGRRDEAEEVLQDAFLQLWRQADRYRPEKASPRSWLLMLARSRALDRMRSQGARTLREEATYRDGIFATVSPAAGTSELEERERQELLSTALSSLPDEQRLCLELAYFKGLSQSQIATHLDAPLGTVKSRMLLGMRKLRALVKARQG